MRIALVVGVALVMLTLGACGLFDGGNGGGYKLEQTSTWNGSRISGSVVNSGSSKVSCVYVEYALRDDRSRTIKTVSAKKSSGLSPSQRWKFQINASAVGAKSRILTRLEPC